MSKRLLIFTAVIIMAAVWWCCLSGGFPARESVPLNRTTVPNNNIDNKNLYIIFLNGLGCRCDGTLYENMGFEDIRKQLVNSGYSYYDDRFLMYSYTGGRMERGQWHPNKYTKKDTGQPIALSVLNLENMMEEFSSAHPYAKFVLIGHSLGGRVALDYAAAADASQREMIKGVITLNSPLLGAAGRIPGLVLRLPDSWGSAFAGVAVKQLVWEFDIATELRFLRRAQIEELLDSGVRVATFSTRQDFLVPFNAGCLLDEKGEPVTDGFVVDVNRFSVKDISGHLQILKKEEIVNYINTLCVGN